MKRKEIIVIIILLTAALTALLLFRHVYKNRIMITVKNAEGEILLNVPLDDGYYTLQGKNGIFHLEVKDGAYRAHDVDCPNHDCEETGWVDPDNYRPIICLPNGIIVELSE